MKPGDLVMVNFGPGPDNGLPAHLRDLLDFHDGKVGVVLSHIAGRWWMIMVGERKVEMDINTLEVLNAQGG